MAVQNHGNIANGQQNRQIPQPNPGLIFGEIEEPILHALKTRYETVLKDPEAVFEHEIKRHLIKYSILKLDPQEQQKIIDEVKGIGTDIKAKLPQVNERTAVKPVQFIHSATPYTADLISIISTRLSNLGILPYFRQDVINDSISTIRHEVSQDQVTHDGHAYRNMSAAPLPQNGTSVDDFVKNVKRTSNGLELAPEFAEPLYLNKGNVGTAVRTLWELVTATHLNGTSQEQKVASYDAAAFFADKTAAQGWLEQAANTLYQRQILALNTPITPNDTPTDIAQKATMVDVDGAQKIHDKYQQLKGQGTDLMDANGANKPTPARIILRMNPQEQQQLFDAHYSRGVQNATFLKFGFNAMLALAALDQIGQYLANRQDYDNLNADPVAKQDMETSLANAPFRDAQLLWEYRGRDLKTVDELIQNRDEFETAYNDLLRQL